MANTRYLIIAMVLLQSANVHTMMAEVTNEKKVHLVELDSETGMQWMKESSFSAAFYRLVRYFSPQKNLAYCGVASSVMVLNSLPVPRPNDPAHPSYPFFTQENFFTRAVCQIKKPEEVAMSGVSLGELTKMLNSHNGIVARETYAMNIDMATFRKVVTASLAGNKTFILINYIRRAVGQKSGGHISPIAAYHEGSDAFLVLDVSQYKYAPVWIPVPMLFSAMAEAVEGEKVSRGFVLVGVKE